MIVSKELSQLLKTELSIRHINMGLLNRIIINDLTLDDRTGKEMVKIARLSAKIELSSLWHGKISISNIQLFGFDIHIEKVTPQSPPNFQFIIDTFASKDTVHRDNNLNLRINSLLIRRGRLSYNVLSAPHTPGKFNPQHIQLQNIIASISLKALQNDSLNAAIKRLSVEEAHSGFELKKLSLKAVANQRHLYVHDFAIELPQTSLQMDTIRMEYKNMEAFKNFASDVKFSIRMKPSTLILQDFAGFLPTFKHFKDKLQIGFEANGTIDQIHCPHISLSAGNHFGLKGDVMLQDLSRPYDALIYGELSSLHADSEGIALLYRNLKNSEQIPQPLQNLGWVSFHGVISGYFNDLVTYGHVRTGLGEIKTDVKLSSNKEKGIFAYSGTLETADFQLGHLIESQKLDKISFSLDVNGVHRNKFRPAIVLKGLVASVDYSGYTYQNITLDGEYRHGGFSGKAALNDANGSFAINGHINTTSRVPSFNFDARIGNFRPYDLNLTKDYKDTSFSTQIYANFTGGSIDEMEGNIHIDSLQIATAAQTYRLDSIRITATRIDSTQKRLSLTSPFLYGNIEGDYSYHTLPNSVMNLMHRYVPALSAPSTLPSRDVSNNFAFDILLVNTDFLSEALQLPLKVYAQSTLKGYFNDKAQRLRIEGYFPRFRYKDKYFESGMILCENPNSRFHTRLRFTHRKSQGSINVSAEATVQNDSIRTILNWGNSSAVTYSGKLAAVTHFARHIAEESHPSFPHSSSTATPSAKASAFKATIDIQPTRIILNDTLWQIHPSKVVIDSGRIHVHNFNFSNQKRHLHIDGVISDRKEDTVRIDLRRINIGYVFDIADLGVNFQGEASGPAYANSVLKNPSMHTDLFIRNLGLNNALLGDAQIHGEWHNDVKGILLDARIAESDIAKTHVHGYIYPIKPTSSLDLQIEADNTNLQFIHYYMRSITPEFKGRARGHVHFYGKFKALTMEGKVDADASLKVEVLNTTFSVKDSIDIAPEGLTFRNNRIFDTQGHQGTLSGELRYEHFKNLRYSFRFNTRNMLVMNTKESADFPFYGTVYATGNASIEGNQQNGVNIDVAMTTNRNSTFTYIKDFIPTATNSQFIRFVDKTPRRAVQDSVRLSYYEQARQEIEKEQQESAHDTDIRLNILVDATPDINMRIIMDPMAGDNISGRGSGSIRTEFYNKGDVKMFGNYRINQGVYKFSLQEVIRKDFIIKEGSTVAFNGSPLDATLNIKASYIVNSASLNDLMPNPEAYVDQTNVKVECIMNLSGALTSPDIRMELELPNERDEVQALVRNYIPTDEQMNMQILYLLSIGRFYTPDNVDTQNSNMMSSMLSSTLSGQLTNALSHIIDNNNWNIGTNFTTGEKGWSDLESFEGMLSGQLLNNRLIINGNFGYRDNPLANTNFVGDFEAEWLVNRSGNIRLKAYNETNDRYYTKTNLTTQGIGIIFKKDFDKWRELLFWNQLIWKRRQKKLREQKQVQDTTATAPTVVPSIKE